MAIIPLECLKFAQSNRKLAKRLVSYLFCSQQSGSQSFPYTVIRHCLVSPFFGAGGGVGAEKWREKVFF